MRACGWDIRCGRKEGRKEDNKWMAREREREIGRQDRRAEVRINSSEEKRRVDVFDVSILFIERSTLDKVAGWIRFKESALGVEPFQPYKTDCPDRGSVSYDKLGLSKLL